MSKEFTCDLDVYGGKRTLHVSYASMANPTMDQEIRIRARMPVMFRRVVAATNHAFARGLGCRNADELMKSRPTAMPYTRLKDWLKIQRKLIANPKNSAWNEESFDFIYGNIRKEWRLDNHNDTKEIFKRLLGKDQAALHRETVAPFCKDDKAKVFKESLLGIISAFNLPHVYVNIAKMDAVGSSTTSFGGWRAYTHNVWDPSSKDTSYDRSRMEQQLVSARAKENPISLNVDYVSPQDEGKGYDNVYGKNLTLEDHLTKTFIHEGSHMWCGAEDHYYWRPKDNGLRAYASLSRKSGVGSNQLIAPGEVETERSIINADTFGWFIYWWGNA